MKKTLKLLLLAPAAFAAAALMTSCPSAGG